MRRLFPEVINKRRKIPVAEKQAPEIRPIVKHQLSRELQLYFDKIFEALRGPDEKLRDAALHSVANDAGLHPLVPYFVQTIADDVAQNLRNLQLLKSLMRLVRALFDSPHIRKHVCCVLCGCSWLLSRH